MTSGCQLGTDAAIMRTLLLGVEKRPAGRLDKIEEKSSRKIHVVRLELNETFVGRSDAHEHTAIVAEFKSQNSNAKSKKEMANRLNEFCSVFSV